MVSSKFICLFILLHLEVITKAKMMQSLCHHPLYWQWRSKVTEIGQYIRQYIEQFIEKRKYRKVYYMNFTLVETNMISDIQEKNEETNDDYNEMVTTNKQPITTSVDKKRLNKTVICPKCNKSMNNKTFTYSHDCQKIKQPTMKPTSITEVNTPITDEQVETYLQKQEVISRDTLILQRKERFDKMMSRAF